MYRSLNPYSSTAFRGRRPVGAVVAFLLALFLLVPAAQAQIVPEDPDQAPIPGIQISLDKTSVLLTGQGDTTQLRLDIDYTADTPTVLPKIAWKVSNPDVVELKYLSYDRRNVSIRALRPLGSSMVHAYVGGAVVSASVTVAQLNSGVKVLDLSWIAGLENLENPFTEGLMQELTLWRNPQTENIRLGDLLVASGGTDTVHGVLTRVTKIDSSSSRSQLFVTGVLASLEEVYYELDLQATGAPGLSYVPAPGSEEAQKSGLVEFFCQTSSDLVEMEVSGPSATLPADAVRPIIDLRISQGRLQGFTLGAETNLSFSYAGPTASITAGLFFDFECATPIPFILPPLPIPGTPVSLTTLPYVGFEGDIDMELGHVELSSGKLDFVFVSRFGVDYNHNTRTWTKFQDTTGPSYELESARLEAQLDVRLDAYVGPYLRAQFGLAPVGFEWLATVNLFNLKVRDNTSLDVPATAILYDPAPPNTSYDNPTWGRSTVGEAWLEFSFGGLGGTLFKIFVGSIAPDVPYFDFETPALFTLEEDKGSTPIVTLDAPAALPVGASTTLDVRLRPFSEVADTLMAGRPVEIWGSRDGAPAVLLGETTVDGIGNASIGWTPTQAGPWRISAQVFDRVTGWVGLPVISEEVVVQVGPGHPFDGLYDITMTASGSGNGNSGSCGADTQIEVVSSQISESFPCPGTFNGSPVTVQVTLVGTVDGSGALVGTISGSANGYSDSTDWTGSIDPQTFSFQSGFTGLELGVSYSGTLDGGPAVP